MNTLKLSQIVGGKHKGKATPFYGFSIDSRAVTPGQIFIALKGKVHDGHDFVQGALEKGATGVIVEKPVSVPDGVPCVLVQNSLKALRSFARWRRENFMGKVIAVAGSAGKTTTKELIAHLLSKVGKVCKTPKNYNSQIGVPLSVANFEEDCHFWVVEVGASQRGEIKRLVELLDPHLRVITAIGEEHLQTFGSVEEVLAGNREIFFNMKESDWAVCPHQVAHHYRLSKVLTFGGEDFRAREVELSIEGVKFKVNGVDLFLPVPSLAIVENALCAFRVLGALGVNWEDLRWHLSKFQPVEGRFRVLRKGSLVLIDDTYNANPPSVRMALRSLSMLEGYRVAVLGDMLELGKDSPLYHKEVGRLCKELGIDLCLFYGEQMKQAYEECLRLGGNCAFFENPQDIFKTLQGLREAVILYKGSRGIAMERLLEGFMNE